MTDDACVDVIQRESTYSKGGEDTGGSAADLHDGGGETEDTGALLLVVDDDLLQTTRDRGESGRHHQERPEVLREEGDDGEEGTCSGDDGEAVAHCGLREGPAEIDDDCVLHEDDEGLSVCREGSTGENVVGSDACEGEHLEV